MLNSFEQGFTEGPEGVKSTGKMGAGNCLFFAGKMGFHALGQWDSLCKMAIENGKEIKICVRQSLRL